MHQGLRCHMSVQTSHRPCHAPDATSSSRPPPPQPLPHSARSPQQPRRSAPSSARRPPAQPGNSRIRTVPVPSARPAVWQRRTWPSCIAFGRERVVAEWRLLGRFRAIQRRAARVARVAGAGGMVENAAGRWHSFCSVPAGRVVRYHRRHHVSIHRCDDSRPILVGAVRCALVLATAATPAPAQDLADPADEQHERAADCRQPRQRPHRVGERRTGHLSPNDGRRHDVEGRARSRRRLAAVSRCARGRREYRLAAQHRERKPIADLQDDGCRRQLDAAVHQSRLRRVLRLHGLLGRPARPRHR